MPSTSSYFPLIFQFLLVAMKRKVNFPFFGFLLDLFGENWIKDEILEMEEWIDECFLAFLLLLQG